MSSFQALYDWGCRVAWLVLKHGRRVINHIDSTTFLERVIKEGDNPVGEIDMAW